ncbi:stage II sporulation protein P [Pseudalkalibacillus hwajinpoensis]|uniref:Stage II sporulation protein P n=1 Tax=Guptibacillus hwajinpoensis TaxID=208199 RepID=A0A4U1MEZ2_9BACL|nr:stage II sporulation protein P [Pseudalkalibacillus hwajinpoensis]TKD68824.1 stage II sporulation protein P [Pseudalkalibacillus hwajinpoensis]
MKSNSIKLFSDRSSSQIRAFSFITIIGLVILFILAGIISSSETKYQLSSSMIHDWITSFSTEAMVYGMGTENHYLTQVLPEESEPPALSLVAFQFITSIKPGDIRSLVGGELPGFALYDAKIHVAGEGTNFTNLPVESAPPLNELLKERDVSSDKLQIQDSKDQVTPPLHTTNGRKVAFIYHSHSYESYLPLLGLEGEKNANLANDGKTNITLVGKMLGEELENRGIGTQVDDSNIGALLNKKGWEHGKAYDVSRTIVQSAMGGNDGLDLFIDIHRDSLREKDTTVTINNKEYARTVFVIGEENPNYEKNLALAKDLHEALKKEYPGLSRGVIGKKGQGVDGIYNQDLSPSALLIEIGGVDNNLEQLSRTVKAIADVMSEHYWSTQKVSN